MRMLCDDVMVCLSQVSTMGAAAPQTATFFMLYLAFTGLAQKPLRFLRIPGVSLHQNVYPKHF